VIVCLVARRIWTHGLGGLEDHSRNATIELVRQGHAVHVLTTAHPDGRTEVTAYGAIIHYLVGTPPGDYSRAWWRESGRWARAHFARLGIDAVLSMSAAAGGLVGLEGPPIFTIVVGWGWNQLRSFWHDSRGWRRLIDVPRSALWLLTVFPRSRALLRASARVLPVSAEIERQLRSYRVCRLPNFVETSKFAENPAARADLRARLGLSERDCAALMVGTFSRQKGVHLGLAACAAVARERPDLAAVVVGGGPVAVEIEAEAHRRWPHLRALFTGPQPNEEIARFYGAADVFLLPSLRQEGLPTVILEAMASRLPVVAMRAGGTPSGVADGETGLLVPLGDLRAFAAALRVLVADPDLRAAMGKAGHDRALREFDRAVVVRRLVEIMKGAPC
jgi:glycosyltransferase involved in cell wall biosynthesis